MASSAQLILYSRHACHLCDVMQAELATKIDSAEVEVELRDVDARDDWRSEYGLRVPILFGADGALLSEYHLDEARLLDWLENNS